MGFDGGGGNDCINIGCEGFIFYFLQDKQSCRRLTVLSEAYSSRYKNVLSKGSFERAVKNFRERRATSPPPHTTRTRLHSRSPSRDVSPDRTYTREQAKRDLEALPAELLNHAKAFHEHIHYFLNNSNSSDPPQSLNKLLNEIAESEHMDDKLKREVLGDDGARKVGGCILCSGVWYQLVTHRHYL